MPIFQGKNVRVDTVAPDVAALVLDGAQDRTNLLTPTFVDELDEALSQVADRPEYAFLVVYGTKPAGFCGGVDPHWLAERGSPDEMAAFARRGQHLCAKLADLRIPTIAVIAGACLGAGLELALACDYRHLVNRPSTVLAFTQLDLGLIPCWGSTRRLPRLIGFENSLKLLTGGRRLRATEALALGLADSIGSASDPAPSYLASPCKRDWAQAPRLPWRQHLLDAHVWGRRLIFRGARRILRDRLPSDMPAPVEALDALECAARAPTLVDASPLEFEQQAAARLASSAAFHNLLHLRLARDRLRAEAPKHDGARYVRAIGVVGANATGLSFVQQALLRGCRVVLHDEDKAALGHVSLELHRAILHEEVTRGTITPDAALSALRAFRGTATWEQFDQLDLVLDAGPAVGQAERFRHLDTITAPATILVSTGPADTTANLRKGLRHPLRVAVLHFAGLPAQTAIVELARPVEVAEPVLRRLGEWVTAMGKICVPVADCPGLLVLRVWMPGFNEAAWLLSEGIPTERIDEAMTKFGMAQGPLEWMDRLGLDAVAHLVEALHPAMVGRLTFDGGFAAMAQEQFLGVRTGVGFYRHAGVHHRPNLQIASRWQENHSLVSAPVLSRADQMSVVQQRIAAMTVLEAYYCLRDRIVDDADTLDVVLATTGWAPHRGGPLTFARQIGVDAFIARLEGLARAHGPRFAPPPELREFLATNASAPRPAK